MARPSSPPPQPPLAALPCVCANVRRLARMTTRLYDEALRPAGLEVGQFGLLATIRRIPGISQAQMSRRLAMDTTSLSRTLDVLLRHRWIEKAEGADRRNRVFTITAAGEARLASARPHWERAQQQLASIVGARRVTELVDAVEAAASALNGEVADLPRARRSARRQTSTPATRSLRR